MYSTSVNCISYFSEAKKAHSVAVNRITEMEVLYSNVVPRVEYDALSDECKKLKAMIEAHEIAYSRVEIEKK